MKYEIESVKASRTIIKHLPEGENIQDWIAAHLDMSAEPWTYTRICDRCDKNYHKEPQDCKYYGSGVGGNEIPRW